MKHLRIHAINDLHFGKHQGANFTDLDHDFVVFYGLNESGKSTIAEYLTWTLGGPWRPAGDGSERFRSLTNDHVSGRLVGSLAEEKLDIDAKFKILRTGMPNDLRSGITGKRSIAATEFSVLFSGLTPEDFRWIYRLYGVELGRIGTSEDFSNLFSSFTMGNAKTNVNPRERAKGLSQASVRLAREVQGLEKKYRQLESQIKEAKKAPDHLHTLRTQLSSIETELAALGEELINLQEQKQLIVNARSGSGAIGKQRQFEAELEILGSVPGKWGEIVPQASELRRLQREKEAAEQELEKSKAKVANSLTRVGLRSEDLTGQTLSATERQQLQLASQELGASEKNITQADIAIADLDRQVVTLTGEINSLAPSVGVTSTNFDSLLKQAHSLNELQGPAALWLQASQQVASDKSSLAAAQAQLAEISIQRDPDQATTEAKMNPALLIVALILIGGLSLISPIVSIIGAVGSAIGLAVLSKKGIVRQPTDFDQAARIREMQNKVAQAQADLAAAETRYDDAASRVIEPLTKIGSSIPNPDIARSMIVQLINLANKLTERQGIYQRLDDGREQRKLADQDLSTAKNDLYGLLQLRHIVNVPSTEGFATWLTDYEDAVNATQEQSGFAEKYSALNASINVILAPVKAEITGLSWAAINTMLSEYEELSERIKTTQQNLRESNIEVSAAGMDEVEIRAILETYSSKEALDDREKILIDQIELKVVERDGQIVRRTEINGEIKEKQSAEVLPSLLQELGETTELLEETRRDHDAHVLASKMLEEMINRFERDNQDPLIQEAQQIISRVVPNWGSLMYSRDSAGKVLIERDGAGGKLVDSRLSDGGRSLLYLGIRLAFANKDAEKRGICLPLICDDPFVHFDDERTAASIEMFKSVAQKHQVILFTCEESTRDMARAQGAHIIEI